MKVLKPVGKKNPQTQGYSAKHKGYDHDDLPDQNYYSSIYGKIIQSKNSEKRQWQAFTNNDPYKDVRKGKLLTEDYGNYLIIEGEFDGQSVKQLGAHLQEGTVLPKGTEVKAGQVVAKIGKTGNTTPVGGGDGSHSHTEYRDENSKNFAVEFIDAITEPAKPNMQTEEQIIIDVYKATTGEYPSDDEKKARLQEHKNTVEVIEDRLRGDGRARTKWIAEWKVQEADDIDYKTAAEQYKSSYDELKVLLRLPLGDNTEDVLGAISGLQERVKQLEKANVAQTIYKFEGKDYEKVIKISNLIIILEKAVV